MLDKIENSEYNAFKRLESDGIGPLLFVLGKNIQHYYGGENLKKTRAKQEATVLLVEDEEGIRNDLAELLGLFFTDVCPVSSAEAALDFLKTSSVRLIITDVNLPKMSGIQLLKRVRVMFAYMPVAVLSGNGHRAQAEELGARFYPKPLPNVLEFLRDMRELAG